MQQLDTPDLGSSPPTREVPGHVLRGLMELSAGLRKHAMYPPDHPVLVPVADQVREHLLGCLAESKTLTLRVERDRLEVGGARTDPANPLLSGLANRLHSHQILMVTFRNGIAPSEVTELLRTLAREVDRGEQPLGLAPTAERDRWPHVVVRPIEYDPLRLGTGDADVEGAEGRGRWTGVDAPPFSTEIAGKDLLVDEGEDVAKAIEKRKGGESVDRWIAVRIFRLADDLRDASGEAAEVVMDRMSDMILSLEPETLAYMMRLGDEGSRTNQFIRDASEWMEADAIIELVRTAGENRSDSIAPWLVRLTSKMARFRSKHADGGQDEADASIRSVVRRMASEWELEDPRPVEYAEDLTRYLRQAPAEPTLAIEGASSVEPERIVETSIEIDEPNELARQASARLVREGDARALLDRLERAPEGNAAARDLWQGLSTPDAIRQMLEVEPPKLDVCDRIIEILGKDAAQPMLEVLARSRVRAVRRYLFDKISRMGPSVGTHIVALLDHPRWYVVRNMLGLLRSLQIWPWNFDVAPFLRHDEPRVRLEAVKLAATRAAEREAAICIGLEDDDERVVAAAVSEAASGCPPRAETTLLRFVRRGRLPVGVRSKAVKALGTLESPRAMKGIVRACRRRRWLLRTELAPEYPVVLEGVRAIARHRPDTRAARTLLRLAAESDDAELKWAAAGDRSEFAFASNEYDDSSWDATGEHLDDHDGPDSREGDAA